MNGLEISKITRKFGSAVAVNEVSLSISEGELFFLLGPSGCGKTTLLRMVAGLYQPDAGQIRFRGQDLLAKPIEKRNIGMVFQNYSLWPHMTVFDNVAYGLKMRKIDRNEIAKRVSSALTIVDMQGMDDRKPGALSGGQQQRIALARALVYEPELILLDEPLSNLDAKLRKEMRAEIKRIQRQLKVTMVYVTHDQEEAAAMADRMALMNKGEIEQVGTPGDLYAHPASIFAAQFFGHANVLKGKVHQATPELVTVACGSVSLVAQSRQPFAVGDSVHVVFRPEHCRFAVSESGRNIIKGRVGHREFIGAVRNHTVVSEDQPISVMSIAGPGIDPEVGSEVAIAVDQREICILRD
jgi:iron(III) transport system ATP-binding protein